MQFAILERYSPNYPDYCFSRLIKAFLTGAPRSPWAWLTSAHSHSLYSRTVQPSYSIIIEPVAKLVFSMSQTNSINTFALMLLNDFGFRLSWNLCFFVTYGGVMSLKIIKRLRIRILSGIASFIKIGMTQRICELILVLVFAAWLSTQRQLVIVRIFQTKSLPLALGDVDNIQTYLQKASIFM